MITWYVSFFFLVENSVVFNYTCRTSILSILFYCSKFTDSWWYCFKIFFAKKNKFNSISYIYIYPSILQNPQLGVDKFLWQTVIDESSSRCQFPLQTEVKIQLSVISKFLQLLSFFFFLPVLCWCQNERCKNHNRTEFCGEKKPHKD